MATKPKSNAAAKLAAAAGATTPPQVPNLAATPPTPQPAPTPPTGAAAPSSLPPLEVVDKTTPTPAKSAKPAADAAEKARLEQLEKDKAAFKIVESTRNVDEIIAERVTVGAGFSSLTISPETPLPEWLQILDYTVKMAEQSQFFIGDALNFAAATYGDSYIWAMEKTGRSFHTLREYKRVAQLIPPAMRVPTLAYTLHKEAAPIMLDDRMPQKEREKKVREVLKVAKKENQTKLEVREVVKKISPPVAKVGKGAGRGGSRKGAGPKKKKGKASKGAPAPKEANPEEIAALDSVFELVGQLSGILDQKHGGADKPLRQSVLEMDYNRKHSLLGVMKDIGLFVFQLEKYEGYPGH
jgi:hypothetical protein